MTLATLARIRHLLLDPRGEWPLIAAEPADARALAAYVAMLAAIPALCGFIGALMTGMEVSAGTIRAPLPLIATKAVISFLLSFVIVLLTALAVEALAPLFGARRHFAGGLKLAVYSFTPVWLVGVVLLVPPLRFLSILGLYALRLLWTGLPVLKGVRRRQALVYAVAVATAAFAITLVMAAVQGALLAWLFHE